MTQSLFDIIPRSRLNQNSAELQEELLMWRAKFCETDAVFQNGTRADIPSFGMLSMLARRTPFLIYDLPELKEKVPTAFVDGVRCYFSDSFFRQLVLEEISGGSSLMFLIGHEMEHLRRQHTTRMTDIDHAIANVAQDIRINGDLLRLITGKRLQKQGKPHTSAGQFQTELKETSEQVGDVVKMGCGTSFADLEKWGLKSENFIAMEMIKEAKDKPKPQPPKSAALSELAEAVLSDMSNLAAAADANDPSAASEIRKLKDMVEEAATGKKSATRELLDAMANLNNTSGMRQLDARHVSELKAGTSGQTATSRTLPSLRNDMLRSELAQKNQSKNKAGKGVGDGNASEDAPKHTLTPEEVRNLLAKNGLHDTIKKLGYDDLEKMDVIQEDAKNNVVSAINEASAMKQRYGHVMPGAHMVDYAIEQVNAFYNPVMSWKKEVMEIIEKARNKVRYDTTEPWEMFQGAQDLYSDMGMDSPDDVPYLGSYIPGGTDRPVILWMIDSSGSMNNHLLRRGASEALGMARENDSEFAAEVIILFADTLVRGQPVFVTEDNIDEMVNGTLGVNGRGGTNFTACLQQIEHMREEGGALEGRKIEHLIYFTDTFDSPPRKQDMPENLPPVLFVAPQEVYYNESFRKGIEGFADIVYYSEEEMAADNEVDLDAHKEQIDSKRTVCNTAFAGRP